jgi:hypothetical protein
VKDDLVYIVFYFENRDTGLYTAGTVSVTYSYDDFDEADGNAISFSEDLTTDAINYISGTATRFMISDESRTEELHINEVDDFDITN